MVLEWRRGHTIGHGSSATVSLATTSCGGITDIFAVKSAELSKSETLQREQRILSSLCSPYVVSYNGYNITMENNKLMYNLIMEYMPLGSLTQQIHRHGGRLDEGSIVYYTHQVLQGLEYLHSNGLVHCDIKGTNILIGEGGAKIGDFGCAKRVTDSPETVDARAISGTPMFMAPEVARGEEQGYGCDIWALGCTVIEMATGVAPWPNLNDPVSVLYRIAHSNEVPEVPGFLSEQGKDFLQKCFSRNSKERWTASQLLKHPFLGESSSNFKHIQESNSSSSPTSILQQGFWNSVEESESLVGNLIQTSSESSPAGRVRRLALCSGEPSWARDGNWITARGNIEVYSNCGSETASTSDRLASVEELGKSNASSTISGFFRQDDKPRRVSVVVSNLNFERCIVEMSLPSTFEFS